MDSVNTSALNNEQQLIIVHVEAPWLQMNGQPTPEDHLKILTPQWSPEIWERYLSWFENQTGQRSESLVLPKKYDQICEAQEESIFVFSQGNADDDLRGLVSEYLKTLTHLQRRVIEMIFWDGRSTRNVAQELGIRHQSVAKLKKRALNKIKDLLREGATSRIMRGETSLIVKGGTDEENLLLAESYLAEAG